MELIYIFIYIYIDTVYCTYDKNILWLVNLPPPNIAPSEKKGVDRN